MVRDKWPMILEKVKGNNYLEFIEWFLGHFNPSDREEFICAVACLCDTIWSTRNEAFFQNGKVDPLEMDRNAMQHCQEFLKTKEESLEI